MKKYILILLLFLSTPCFADTVTGVPDFCTQSDSNLIIRISGEYYETSNIVLHDLLLYAFRYGQQITVDYTVNGSDNSINFVSLSTTGEYYMKMVSLFIGAVSAVAFSFGLGVKFS